MKNPDTLKIAKKFNWASVTYDLNPERLSRINHFLIGGKILEVGCGGGAYSDYLTQKGFNIIALDQSLQLLHFAKEKKYRGEFIQGNIECLPFADNSFDCSYCFDVLEHVNDKQAYSELSRVTKNRIIFTVPQEDNLFNRYGLVPFSYQDMTHLRYYNQKKIEDLIHTFAYKNIHIIDEGILPLGELWQALSKFNNEKNIIQNLLYPSVRLNSFKTKLINNKFFESIVCSMISMVFNKDKIKRILFKGSSYQQINSGLFVIIDLQTENEI